MELCQVTGCHNEDFVYFTAQPAARISRSVTGIWTGRNGEKRPGDLTTQRTETRLPKADLRLVSSSQAA